MLAELEAAALTLPLGARPVIARNRNARARWANSAEAHDPARHAPVRTTDRAYRSKDIFREIRAVALVVRARPMNGSDRGVASLARSDLGR